MFLKASIKLIPVPENPGFGKYPSPWPPNVIHFSLLAVCCCNCGRYIIEFLSVLRIGACYFQSANIPKFIALGPNLHLFVKKFQICSQEIFLEFLSLFDLVYCVCVYILLWPGASFQFGIVKSLLLPPGKFYRRPCCIMQRLLER